jgi:hypothetical protein
VSAGKDGKLVGAKKFGEFEFESLTYQLLEPLFDLGTVLQQEQSVDRTQYLPKPRPIVTENRGFVFEHYQVLSSDGPDLQWHLDPEPSFDLLVLTFHSSAM